MTLNVVCMADVEPQQVDWLWKGRIARGKMNQLCGNPGLGKSFTTVDFAYRCSTGTPWPDGQPCPLGSVLFMMAEDGLADTMRPRLDAAGADCSRVFVLQSRRLIPEEGGEPVDAHISLERDIAQIEEFLESRPDIVMVVIDPVSEYMGTDCDSHKNTDVRRVLAPLASMAERRNVAICTITHLNKSAGGPAIYRAMGSLAFTAQARVAHAFVEDFNEPGRVLMLPLKNNIHAKMPGLAFRIVDDRLQWFEDEVTISADDAMNAGNGNARKRDKLAEACAWLKQRLHGSEAVESDALGKEAVEAGHAFRTYIRAKKEIGATSVKAKGADGKWYVSWTDPTAPKNAKSPQQLIGIVGTDGILTEEGCQEFQECQDNQTVGVGTDDYGHLNGWQ